MPYHGKLVWPTMKNAASKATYHHGDLHDCLLKAATEIIAESGVDALSMRKLADRVGVSRTAPYHHFRDKQALLSALALNGFRTYIAEVEQISLDKQLSPDQKLEQFVRYYLRFAMQNPEIYNLMFGHSLWKSGQPSEELRAEAHESFRRFVSFVAQWQQDGAIPPGCEPLRFSQVAWSALHGLCRLVIDGIYVEPSSIDAICDTLLAMFRQQIGTLQPSESS